MQEISSEIYNKAQTESKPNNTSGNGENGDDGKGKEKVYDADFKVEDDKENEKK